MRVAALYDVHGNLPALVAVLTEIDREGVVDEIVVGGDVLWGPLQSECVQLLQNVGATFVSGNCERDVLEPDSEIDRWCNGNLGEQERAVVASWPLTVERDLAGIGSVIFCHATPHDDETILTRITPDEVVAAELMGVDAAVVVCGHTHVQFDRRLPGGNRLVNAGSVGLPYEGAAGAYWALIGPDVVLRRTAYDVERALAELRATGFPTFEDVFARSLEGGVTAAEATTEFESKRDA